MVKNLPANVEDIRDAGSIPGSGSPGGEHGNSLQYSCLENPMDRGAWWATVDRVAESETTKVAQHAHRNYAVFLFFSYFGIVIVTIVRKYLKNSSHSLSFTLKT